MKRLFKLAVVAVAVFSIGSASAQKLARINMQEVIVAMPEFAEMQKQLEVFGKDLQDQLEQIQVEFNNRAEEFQKNQATMAASVKQMKQQELQQIQQRYEEFNRIAQEDFQKKQAELVKPIIEKAQAAISKISKAAGYIAVFDTANQSLAFYDEKLLVDIAALVKKELGIVEKPATTPAPAK